MHSRLRNRLLLLTAGAVIAGLIAAPGAAAVQTTTTSTKVVADFISPTWEYYTGRPAVSWRTDDAGWQTGSAPFGRGRDVGSVNTTLTQDGVQQPLATYFRKQLRLNEDLPESMKIVTWADDGIIAYVNGQEVGRYNIAPGALKSVTYATRAPQSKKARVSLVTFDVPVSLLHAGRNTVAFQVAANWRQSPNVTFAAQIVRTDTVAAVTTPPPAVAPAPTATASPSPTPEPTPSPSTTPTATPSPKPTAAPAPVPAGDGGPVLPGWGSPVFDDEFTYRDPATGTPAVDPTKWNVRSRNDLGLLPDAAVVDPKQVTVDSSGMLHIRADWLDKPIIRPSGQAGAPEIWHATGYLDQRKLQSDDMSFAQQYGRWEIRAKVPTGPKTLGALAAFWLRNQQSGEIDIMEAWGYDNGPLRDQKINSATTTVHTHTSDPSQNSKFFWTHSEHGGPVPVWSDFHTFAFELTPSYAAIIVDGKELARTTPAKNPSLWDSRYFGSPLHVRLNLHVGPSATYWGLPDPDNKSATQNLDFQVDYVRIWSYNG